jgi:hypothetical protein
MEQAHTVVMHWQHVNSMGHGCSDRQGMPLIEHEAAVDIILYLNGVMEMPLLGPIVVRNESSHLDVPLSETRMPFCQDCLR